VKALVIFVENINTRRPLPTTIYGDWKTMCGLSTVVKIVLRRWVLFGDVVDDEFA
jgi:hypothetical protein